MLRVLNRTSSGRYKKKNDTSLLKRKKQSVYRALWFLFQLQGSLILAGGIHFLIGITGLVGVLLRYVGPVTIVPAIFLIGIYLMKATAKFAKVHWGISFM